MSVRIKSEGSVIPHYQRPAEISLQISPNCFELTPAVFFSDMPHDTGCRPYPTFCENREKKSVTFSERFTINARGWNKPADIRPDARQEAMPLTAENSDHGTGLRLDADDFTGFRFLREVGSMKVSIEKALELLPCKQQPKYFPGTELTTEWSMRPVPQNTGAFALRLCRFTPQTGSCLSHPPDLCVGLKKGHNAPTVASGMFRICIR